jgi:hypothetical protein
MRNKANFQKSQMLVTQLNTKNYNEKWTMDTWSKQTQTNPIKPNFIRLRQIQKAGFRIRILTSRIKSFDGATGEVTMIGRLYHGYSITPMGSVIGLLWAFADGLVGGLIFAWLYNLLAGKCRKA